MSVALVSAVLAPLLLGGCTKAPTAEETIDNACATAGAVAAGRPVHEGDSFDQVGQTVEAEHVAAANALTTMHQVPDADRQRFAPFIVSWSAVVDRLDNESRLFSGELSTISTVNQLRANQNAIDTDRAAQQAASAASAASPAGLPHCSAPIPWEPRPAT